MTKPPGGAFNLALDELEGVDELSVRVFRAFMNSLRLHRQLMMAALAELDTHPGQAICLRFLSANDGITQRDLADALHLARPTVSRMLRAMERGGFVERRPDRDDQRLTRVFLTPAGRALEGRLRAVSAATINETIGALSERDRRELGRLLEALGESISAAIDARRDERAARDAGGTAVTAGSVAARRARAERAARRGPSRTAGRTGKARGTARRPA